VKAARGFGESPVTGQLLLKGDAHDGVLDVMAQSEAGAGPVPAAAEFADIYERHFTEVHRYIAGRLGRDVADDIAADTFVIALTKRDGFDPMRGTVRAWLYGIATNLVARQQRAELRRYRALARAGARDLAGGHEERVVSWVAAEELQPQLASALARLSQEERDVLLLVALADFSHEEISQALGIPYGTVGSRPVPPSRGGRLRGAALPPSKPGPPLTSGRPGAGDSATGRPAGLPPGPRPPGPRPRWPL
jgi:RNA polymerase sigma factor (sigma-70 family)